jgi:hypothetical protein
MREIGAGTLSVMTATMRGTAEFSRCRRYRYRLTRQWDAGLPWCAFILLNPSTATATADDPTIRRAIGFARSFGCGGIEVLNLFALRATRPETLWHARDPIGPENDAFLEDLATRPVSPIVAAWGVHGTLRGRDKAVRSLFEARTVRLTCLALTRSGQPRHVLYLKADLRPRLLPFANAAARAMWEDPCRRRSHTCAVDHGIQPLA